MGNDMSMAAQEMATWPRQRLMDYKAQLEKVIADGEADSIEELELGAIGEVLDTNGDAANGFRMAPGFRDVSELRTRLEAAGHNVWIFQTEHDLREYAQAVNFEPEAPTFLCTHDHEHRTEAARDRCEDGASGAATGSRLAQR